MSSVGMWKPLSRVRLKRVSSRLAWGLLESRVRALCGIRVELRRQLLVRVRVRVRARARVRARVRVKAGVRVRVRVEGAPGRSVAWGAPRSRRRGPG